MIATTTNREPKELFLPTPIPNIHDDMNLNEEQAALEQEKEGRAINFPLDIISNNENGTSELKIDDKSHDDKILNDKLTDSSTTTTSSTTTSTEKSNNNNGKYLMAEDLSDVSLDGKDEIHIFSEKNTNKDDKYNKHKYKNHEKDKKKVMLSPEQQETAIKDCENDQQIYKVRDGRNFFYFM